MAYRIVGGLAIILGVGVVALAFSHLLLGEDLFSVMTGPGFTVKLPVTPEEFLFRSRLWAGVIGACGLLTTIGGVGMTLRRTWGVYLTAGAAVAAALVPSLVFVLASGRLEFQGETELLIAGVIGLVAALAFMFRPKYGIDA